MSGTPRLGAAWLLLLGGLLLVAGGVVSLDRLSAAEEARVAAEAGAAADLALRRMAHDLSTLADDVSQGIVDASEGPVPADAAAGEKIWKHVQEVIRSAKAPAGARVDVYDEREEGSSTFVLVARAAAESVRREGLAAEQDVVPPGLLRRQVRRLEADDNPSLLWFAPDEAGGVRLHVMTVHLHEFPEAGGGPEDTPGILRALDASAPFPAPYDRALLVRCDVVGGALAAALPEHRAAGRDPRGLGARAVAGLPADAPAPFPDASPSPRLAVLSPTPGMPLAVGLLLAVGALCLLVAARLLLRSAGDASAAPPDVAAEAAHELKTPLTAMRGSLEVALRRERSPAEYREALSTTLEEVKGLQNLVASVLLLTRGAAAPRANEPVDLAALVRAEVERTQASAPERTVTLEGADVPVAVMGDPGLLARAVGNLLDNAVLHSVAGGAIHVALGGEARSVRVSVLDDGPGIPPSRRERVFERFYRGPEVGQRGIPGSGLGLPIAQWIARSHGGSLGLDPTTTGRSRFVLELPRGAIPPRA